MRIVTQLFQRSAPVHVTGVVLRPYIRLNAQLVFVGALALAVFAALAFVLSSDPFFSILLFVTVGFMLAAAMLMWMGHTRAATLVSAVLVLIATHSFQLVVGTLTPGIFGSILLIPLLIQVHGKNVAVLYTLANILALSAITWYLEVVLNVHHHADALIWGTFTGNVVILLLGSFMLIAITTRGIQSQVEAEIAQQKLREQRDALARTEVALTQVNERLEARVAERTAAMVSVTEQQLHFEKLLSSIATRFLSIAHEQTDAAITAALRDVGEFAGADIARVFRFDEPGSLAINTHEWCRDDRFSQRLAIRNEQRDNTNQWWIDTLSSRPLLRVDDVATLLIESPQVHDQLAQRGVASFIAIPLFSNGRLIGEVGFDTLDRKVVWADDAVVLTQLCASLIGNAIYRAEGVDALTNERNRLEERVNDRTRQLSRVLDVSIGVTELSDAQSVLHLILVRLNDLVKCDSASISEYVDGDFRVIARDRDEAFTQRVEWHYDATQDIHLRAVLETRLPVIIPDVDADTSFAQAFRVRQIRVMGKVPITGTVMYVPMQINAQVTGLLSMTTQQKNGLGESEARLMSAFASFAASAVANAHSYEHAVRAAALEERGRLARELHDSVSQALFGIVLGTRTALAKLSHESDGARDPLNYVMQLSEAALSEMRALIFELHPETLKKEGLIGAFEHQAAALFSRHKIDLRLDTDHNEPNVSLQAKEAFYRVAMEAIQNTLKHAQASRIDLSLKQVDGNLELRLIDNGHGFDPAAVPAGHLGLTSMRERMQRLGGTLSIDSAPGRGTQLLATLPLTSKEPVPS
jgi:signal transduction histidine kinase